MKISLQQYLFMFICIICLSSVAKAKQICCLWHGGPSYCNRRIGKIVCRNGTFSSCLCKKTKTPLYKKNTLPPSTRHLLLKIGSTGVVTRVWKTPLPLYKTIFSEEKGYYLLGLMDDHILNNKTTFEFNKIRFVSLVHLGCNWLRPGTKLQVKYMKYTTKKKLVFTKVLFSGGPRNICIAAIVPNT